MPYAADFRRHVLPRLRAACRYQALGIVLEEQLFSAGCREVISLAHQLGASHLHEDLVWELHDAIAEWLLADVDAAQTEWEAAQKRANVAAEDYARYQQQRSARGLPS